MVGASPQVLPLSRLAIVWGFTSARLLFTFVVMNLQTTMDQEINEVQGLLKRHRQQQATHPQGADAPVDDTEPTDDTLEPVNEAEPVEAEPADGTAMVEAEQTDEAAATDDAQPDEAAPAAEEPISDPPKLPQTAPRRPDDSGGSVATGHKRPRPPP